MTTEAETERVVVIQDASRDVNSNAILGALEWFSVKAGDQLIIVAILDWMSSPMGYMVRVDSSSMISTNKKIIEKRLTKKKEEYLMNQNIQEISNYCKLNEIGFQLEVLVGSTAEVASNAAKEFQATRLILVRQIHKDMKHFVRNLPCGMYRITSDNSIERLKDPKSAVSTKTFALRQENVSYKEMFPGSEEEERSLLSKYFYPIATLSSSSDLLTSTGISSQWSTEVSTSSFGSLRYGCQYQEGKFYSNKEQETTGNQSLFHISENEETSQLQVNKKEQHSRNNETSHMEEEFTNPLCSVCKNRRPNIGLKRDFSYAELHTATQGFSPKNFLSEGGFGSVYKGLLNGMKIAVKQHKYASFQGEKEFKSEVNVLSKARHENVVVLLGSCSEKNNRLLVYEYVCNGSLDQHLSEHSRSPLSWEDRINVAIGAAKGLLYLHKNNMIHRDVRPNNILITHDYHPLLGDFGLARNQNQDSIHSTEVVGTLGYLAPEYAELGKVSTKTDVYSFGVVLLQLITGMRTTDKRLGGRSLVGWARPLLRERNYPDLIDERIINSHDVHQLFWMVRIAEKCLSREPQRRLNMIQVVDALTDIVEGRTCDIILRDYSPARSDSTYSASDSDESEDEMQEPLRFESELLSHSSESIESNNISQMMHMIVRQPPSPPIQSISSSSSSSYKLHYESTSDGEAHNEGEIEISNSNWGLLNS
ncbi:probable serine/threonine-protein kinase PBL26 [Glycine max]|uniref:probable serine/threonine-protein kinase PBL26 n=1 Tax=Glycine max TaxID=3847 RepID=UPI0003DED187|nr:probable serine/threonine-protein kinase PBL26 [Glycine max]|eukprot:XP_006579136.1 probable serine/threonine-protein kinase PBL26 [Glycine max]